MKDMGLMHYFLGLEVWQGDGEMFMSQRKYSSEILQMFHMDNCKTMDTPLATNCRKEDASSRETVDPTIYIQLVGSLMYPKNKRPNICYAFNQFFQAIVKSTILYWKAAKHVLRNVRSTIKYVLWYKRIDGVNLQGFTDSD